MFSLVCACPDRPAELPAYAASLPCYHAQQQLTELSVCLAHMILGMACAKYKDWNFATESAHSSLWGFQHGSVRHGLP